MKTLFASLPEIDEQRSESDKSYREFLRVPTMSAGLYVLPAGATDRQKPHREDEIYYVVRGRARFRWGDRLEFVDEAGPGDFVYVPPYVPHQELNAKKDEPVEAVIVRSGQEPVVVNLDIPSPEEDLTTPQPDPFHSAPGKL